MNISTTFVIINLAHDLVLGRHHAFSLIIAYTRKFNWDLNNNSDNYNDNDEDDDENNNNKKQ